MTWPLSAEEPPASAPRWSLAGHGDESSSSTPANHERARRPHARVPVPGWVSPGELLAAGRAEVTRYGVELIDDKVLSVDPGFVVGLAGGTAVRSATPSNHDRSPRRATRHPGHP